MKTYISIILSLALVQLCRAGEGYQVIQTTTFEKYLRENNLEIAIQLMKNLFRPNSTQHVMDDNPPDFMGFSLNTLETYWTQSLKRNVTFNPDTCILNIPTLQQIQKEQEEPQTRSEKDTPALRDGIRPESNMTYLYTTTCYAGFSALSNYAIEKCLMKHPSKDCFTKEDTELLTLRTVFAKRLGKLTSTSMRVKYFNPAIMQPFFSSNEKKYKSFNNWTVPKWTPGVTDELKCEIYSYMSGQCHGYDVLVYRKDPVCSHGGIVQSENACKWADDMSLYGEPCENAGLSARCRPICFKVDTDCGDKYKYFLGKGMKGGSEWEGVTGMKDCRRRCDMEKTCLGFNVRVGKKYRDTMECSLISSMDGVRDERNGVLAIRQ